MKARYYLEVPLLNVPKRPRWIGSLKRFTIKIIGLSVFLMVISILPKALLQVELPNGKIDAPKWTIMVILIGSIIWMLPLALLIFVKVKYTARLIGRIVIADSGIIVYTDDGDTIRHKLDEISPIKMDFNENGGDYHRIKIDGQNRHYYFSIPNPDVVRKLLYVFKLMKANGHPVAPDTMRSIRSLKESQNFHIDDDMYYIADNVLDVFD